MASNDAEEMKGCAWIIIACAIAFAIVISTFQYWEIK